MASRRRSRPSGYGVGTNQYVTKWPSDLDEPRAKNAATMSAIKGMTETGCTRQERRLMVAAIVDIIRTSPYPWVHEQAEGWADAPVLDLEFLDGAVEPGKAYGSFGTRGAMITHVAASDWRRINETTGGPLIDGHYVAHYHELHDGRPTRVSVLTAIVVPPGMPWGGPEFVSVPVDVTWDGDTPHIHLDHGPELTQQWWDQSGRVDLVAEDGVDPATWRPGRRY